MTVYTLTVSTAALGLGILSNVRVTIQRKKTIVSDTFPSASLTFHETLTNASGVANISLAADDGTVFHEIRVYSSRNMVIYYQAFSMPPQNVALEALPLTDLITESSYQAVQAKDAAQTSATNAANSAAAAAISATNASNSASAASTSATNANNSAIQASIILESTMRKITVNTDNDIPNYNTLLSDHIIKVKSSARNGGFSTTYYFDFDNQSLRWIPTVGI